MSLIDDDRFESIEDNEGMDDLDFDQDETSCEKVKFSYNGKPYTSFTEYTKDYIMKKKGIVYDSSKKIDEKPGMKVIKEAEYITEEPESCPSYPDDVLAKKAHDLLGRETSEELDRSVKSEETVFGYTREEFDKLYQKTNGFNVTCPDNGPVSDMEFGEFLKEGSELIKNGHVRTKDGRDLRDIL